MKKLLFAGILSLLFFPRIYAANPYEDSVIIHKVALFVPLFLDEAFDASNRYKLGKEFPRQSVSGLDFYLGAAYAMDSLEKNGSTTELYVFDTRSRNSNIAKIAKTPIVDSFDLIIGMVTGNEFLQLAYIAQQKHIPFVSATYPNDGGVRKNPELIIVNSKLSSHIQSIYNYIRRNLGTDNLVWFRRKNQADDRLAEVFKAYNNSSDGGVLNIHTAVLPDKFSTSDLKKSLDSLRKNVIICGSLDERFGLSLVDAAAALGDSYQAEVIGMPTWEGIGEFLRTEYDALPIIYSSTYFNPFLQPWVNNLDTAFRRKTYREPTDMLFKGYELTHYFVRMLEKYDSSLLDNLSDPSFQILTEFEFKPIRWSQEANEPDYFENKRIYIIKREEGKLTRLN